ncbi:MAG: helix-turn-helix domain-containing protein [Burkholderiales bacterium]
MVRAVRSGRTVREVAATFGISVGAVAYWVAQARGKRLDRVSLSNRKPGRPWNRTAAKVEQRILSARASLREDSILGEYGPDAIGVALHEDDALEQVPGRTTIYRVLVRHGALDGTHRQRRPAPPKGWYLPDLAAGRAELDSFDFIEDLKIADGPLVSVLTAISLHGALTDAWIMEQVRARTSIDALVERWRREGLPHYAQFDNDTIFQGAHQFADSVGRISRLCLALGVIPVFAPPREPGFQNAIEGFNGLWQSKVWRRHRFPDAATLRAVSARYIAAYRTKTAHRREAAASRRPFPRGFKLDLSAVLKGTMIFLRRSDDGGAVHLLGKAIAVDKHWMHRLVRCEVDFTHRRMRFYALRRRDPDDQPLLRELTYLRADKPFRGTP